uniref:SOWAHA-C winged helix-turn-helix domain-containing protein n=1 Tax=Trichogramma kaykai TaxID=54128 RepID=A0ABD2W2H0_9HYME
MIFPCLLLLLLWGHSVLKVYTGPCAYHHRVDCYSLSCNSVCLRCDDDEVITNGPLRRVSTAALLANLLWHSGKMSSPSELSLEEIRRYLLAQGGSARNQDLVIHFKKFLTDPETRVEARNRFKEYINTLATIKTEEGEKFLVLKKKFRQASLDLSSPTLSFAQYPTSPLSTPDLATPTSPLRDLSLASSIQDPQPPSLKDHFKTPVREAIPPPVRGLALQSSPSRTPPPYRPPPVAPLSPLSNTTSPIRRFPVEPPIGLPLGIPIVEPAIQHVLPSASSRYSESESESSSSSTLPPSVPPRRKSQDKIKFSNKENQGIIDKNKNASETIKEDAMSISSTTSTTSSQQQQPPQMTQQQQKEKEQQQQLEQLSVKERMQRFNRLATETDLAAKAAAVVGVSSPPAAATSKKRADKINKRKVSPKFGDAVVEHTRDDEDARARDVVRFARRKS